MIAESYVSFEVAKLLKEKGFDECTILSYDKNGNNKDALRPFLESEGDLRRPTIQMVMKWLMKVHNLHIEVHYNAFWDYYQYIILYYGEKIESDMAYHSFEDAAETVIKFCLKKLI